MPTHHELTPFFRQLESFGADVWQQDLLTKEINVSVSFWKSLGYDPKLLPLTRDAARGLVHPLDLELATEEVDIHLHSDTPFDVELRIRTSAGQWRYLRLQGCVVAKDDHGLPLYFAGPITDLTQAVEAAHRQSNAAQMISTLSNRECQVLQCLLAGAANKNIAYALGLSRRTIEGYHARVLEKLDAKGTAELTRVALAGGLTGADPAKCGMTRSRETSPSAKLR